jgi:hypothetical protein
MPAFSSLYSAFGYSPTPPPLTAYAEIPLARGISFSGIAATEIDVTSLTSAGKTFVMGTRDNGTVEVSAFVNRTTAPLLPTSGNSTPGAFYCTLGDNITPNSQYIQVTGSCYLQSTSIEGSVDNAVMVTYTFRLTGTITVLPSTVQP